MSVIIAVHDDFPDSSALEVLSVFRFFSNSTADLVSVIEIPELAAAFHSNACYSFETLVESARRRYEVLHKKFSVKINLVFPDVKVRSHIIKGIPALEILQLAGELKPTAMLCGKSSKPDSEELLGSVATQLASHMQSPLILLKNRHPEPLAIALVKGQDYFLPHIIIGFDGSAGADRCLDFIADHQPRCGRVTVVTAIKKPVDEAAARSKFWKLNVGLYRDEIENHAARLRAGISGLKPVVFESPFHAGKGLTEFARVEVPDLVVIGKTGKSLFKKVLIGSVFQYVLHHLNSNVLLIP